MHDPVRSGPWSLGELLLARAGNSGGRAASLEAGPCTADLRALTEGRVAEAAPGTLSAGQLSVLAHGHHREDTQ